MWHLLKRSLVPLFVSLLAASLLSACWGIPPITNPTYQRRDVVERCSAQFSPTIESHGTTSVSSDKLVYFTSGVHLYALDAGNGEMRWCVHAGNAQSHEASLGSIAVSLVGPPPPPDGLSNPAVGNGLVYAYSEVGFVYAFDALSGSLRWKHEIDSYGLTSPTVAGGVVYFDAGTTVYAFDALTGAIRWQYTSENTFFSSPLVVHGTIYVVADPGQVFALTPQGTKLWEYQTGEHLYPGLAFDQGKIFACGWYGSPSLYALDAESGKVLLNKKQNFDGPIAATDGLVYAEGGNHVLYAFDEQDGTRRWSKTMGESIQMLVTPGALYVASSPGGIYAFDPRTGSIIWFNSLNGVQLVRITRPALLDGKLYLAVESFSSDLPATLYTFNAH